MKDKTLYTCLALIAIFFWSSCTTHAQGPLGRSAGFGLIVGEPTGGTVKYWFSKDNSIVASFGGSYFGMPRISVDYLWHFDVFSSRMIELYTGFGGVLGFGKGTDWLYNYDESKFYDRDEGKAGLAARAVVGLNIIPHKTPMEIFIDAGPLIGILPDYGTQFDVSLGIRFYP